LRTVPTAFPGIVGTGRIITPSLAPTRRPKA